MFSLNTLGISFIRSCNRRSRILAPLAADIILARGDARVLAPVAWLAFLGLFSIIGEQSEATLILISSLSLFIGLCLITLFDARYLIIPDGPVIALSVCAPLAWPTFDLQQAVSRFAAAAAGYAALRAIACVYEAARGHAGVGEGDATLYAIAGLWLGFPGLASCMVYATLSALASALIALRLGVLTDMRRPLPFAPHLALGLWLSFVFGPLEFG